MQVPYSLGLKANYMIKKCQNILQKGFLAVLLSLLSLGFIGISSAKAWETCFNEYLADDILLSPTPQHIAEESNEIYFYNKTNPQWNADGAYSQLQWKAKGASISSQDWFSADGGEYTIGGSLPVTNDWGNYLIYGVSESNPPFSNSNYIVQQFFCCAYNNCIVTSHDCFGTSAAATDFCFSNVEPGTTPSEPPTLPALEDPYILYYGNSPYYASINATATFPVVYNICQDWDETKTYQLLLTETSSSSPITEESWLELDGCSGSKNIEFNTGEDEDFYIANIKIIETNTTIVETDNIYFGIVSTIDTSGNMIEFITESPLYINRTGYGTTTVLSFVQMLSEEIATDNEICLLTEKGEKSENCINAEVGIAYKEITIDIPQYDTTQIIKIGLYDENDNLLMTSNSPVMLVIYASFYDTDTWNNQFSSSSASGLLGLNSSQLACSIEEWQDTSWWQTLKCSGKKFAFDIMFILEKLVRAFFGTIMNGMENIFPFSIIANVNQSWTRSATKNLPPDITWIAPEGDLIFTVPANWTGQGTTTEVIAFGDSIFKTGDNSIAIFFQRIRALSKYLIMAGLVWSFVQFGTYFYWKHLAEEQKE